MKMSIVKKFVVVVLVFQINILIAQQYSTKNKKAIKLYEMADSQIKTRQFDEGLINLEKAMSMDKEFTEARYLYAKTYSFLNFNKDSDDMVLKQFEIISEQKPNDPNYIDVYYQMWNVLIIHINVIACF